MTITARSSRIEPGPSLPEPPRPGRISLFADLDGTLAPLEITPDRVGPDPARRRLLDELEVALDGRMAVVSGRTLEDLDRVLEGRVRALGAVHGLIRRTADGRVIEARGLERMGEALEAVRAFAKDDRLLLVENKGAAIALHYRRRPAAAAACLALAREVGARLDLAVQEGDMVVELRPRGPDKGAAVAAFMSEPPFAGFKPVFIGDDLTDEDGFRAAQQLGGYGVIVGPRRPTVARYALPSIAAARAWLQEALKAVR